MNEIFKQWQPSLVKAIVVGFFLFAIACDDEDSPEVDDVQVQESLVSGTWRVTEVWVKQGSDWKEAHHHESPLLGSVRP